MDEDSNVQIKMKGQRKSKKKQDPEETASVQDQVEEQVEEEQLEEEQVEEKPKASAKKSVSKKSAPKVEREDYDFEQQPDVVIHKRHKGAKPRKIIVITGDSDADESDEELPYRAKPKIELKKRQKEPEPEPAPAPKPAPKPKIARKQNVGLVTEREKVVDVGRGLPQRYADVPKKQGYVIDEFIDRLLGL